MDLTESIAPKSDQLDAVDLLSGPRTFTIERVSKHNAEQPFNFHLAEFPRVWRPGKSMRRVIVAAWGPTADKYVGQRVTLYCDPQVQFGGDMVGGTRISHMSGIDKPLKVPLLIKRGKSATFTVQPLAGAAPAAASRDWKAEANALTGNVDALRALYMDAQATGADVDTLTYIQQQAGAIT
ncbi:hypothetical protein PBI_ISOLDE_68 [Arthrobacter phage Isolde]|uniref:Uncharacterized protein n=1 Tax=Arthrobacter phage Isolde TaxID=2419610 RepID=A0A3G3M4J6_9CAUD|nr:hypothetical protein PP638_gp35 [Arthrobacter phage Isolde]AYR01037.1 hypothetical protein PBI_ISOLDE_68 [Arthrobacter phage Isolde]